MTNQFPIGSDQYRLGFATIHQPALNVLWLGGANLAVQAGLEMTLHVDADVWGRFAAGATPGQKVFADYGTGALVAGAAGTPPTNALITATTATDTSLVVTANTGAPIVPGQPISGAGIFAGTTIVSGPVAGGAGTYVLSHATTASAAGVTITAKTAIETPWFVDSVAAAGELAKISVKG